MATVTENRDCLPFCPPPTQPPSAGRSSRGSTILSRYPRALAGVLPKRQTVLHQSSFLLQSSQVCNAVGSAPSRPWNSRRQSLPKGRFRQHEDEDAETPMEKSERQRNRPLPRRSFLTACRLATQTAVISNAGGLFGASEPRREDAGDGATPRPAGGFQQACILYFSPGFFELSFAARS